MNHAWWKTGVVYQIYPRSFQDSDGDGIGDLPGIISRLDYFVDLGVDILWISPFYPSPMRDFGYDIQDFTDVDPKFGTLSDFDKLVKEAHNRGLRVILDLVPNHTSDLHPWFMESRASRSNARRDWYVWRDPAKDGGPPNNWRSTFGGIAWTYDEGRGQYYYHSFLPEQPDLNWRHPEVKEAFFNIMRFWVDRGIDGFRIDAIAHLVEAEHWRDEPENPNYERGLPEFCQLDHIYTLDQPETHAIVRAMRQLLDSYEARNLVMITEAYLPIAQLVTYYGDEVAAEAQLPFNFHLIKTGWEAQAIATLVRDYEAALPKGAWPNWVLGNHDRQRLASRIGPAQARVAAMLLLTLRGTPTIYYGDELGLCDVPIPSELVQDPAELREPGKGIGRDPVRSPMPWSRGKHAGFTSGTPWLPLIENSDDIAVEAQTEQSDSLWTLYGELLRLRHSEPALSVGDYREIYAKRSVFAYARTDGTTTFLVALNFSNGEARLELDRSYKVCLSTFMDLAPSAHRLKEGLLILRPNEGLVLQQP